MAKRVFDLAVCGTLLLLVLPVMSLVALAVRLDSPGPVLFKQKRIGENGRPFVMYKFRSMVADAEVRAREVIQRDASGNVIHKVRNDPRVTRVGAIIRRTSLDELPQLFNVIKGDMSLVGPRPELPWLVEMYEPWQYVRFAVPQGITGWWQINGRSDKPMHLHTHDDLYYVQNYSLLLDIQILWKTLPAMLKKKGAF
jgi:exopolysaccharide biosynthesis polyprenyl glycosylphosphotransferase